MTGDRTQVQDILIPDLELTCAPGATQVTDPLAITAAAIAADGSFNAAATRQGVFRSAAGNYPATYAYSFKGKFTGAGAQGPVTASGTFSETMTYSDTVARTCSSNTRSWTATRDAQPAQPTTLPPTGSYTASVPGYTLVDPITFSLSGGTLQNVSIPVVVLSCAPGGAAAEEPLSIRSASVQPDGSFTATSTGSGVYAGQPATFTYLFLGNFEGVNTSGAARAAGTFRETMKYANGSSYTCDSNNQSWSAALTASG